MKDDVEQSEAPEPTSEQPTSPSGLKALLHNKKVLAITGAILVLVVIVLVLAAPSHKKAAPKITTAKTSAASADINSVSDLQAAVKKINDLDTQSTSQLDQLNSYSK